VGFGDVGSALDQVWCGDGGGSEGGKVKVGAGRKAKDSKRVYMRVYVSKRQWQ